MNCKVIVLLCVVAAAAADKRPSPSYGAPSNAYSAPRQRDSFESYEAEPPKYDFDWIVQDSYTGNDFIHQESRDNDQTKGSYTVQLPDGRLQTVTYYVDGDLGYQAEVTYQGEARYPDSSEYKQDSREYSRDSFESREAPVYSAPAPAPRPRPSYSAPRPTYGFPQ